jgi:uncharacterized repeat protein (TIGR02543 family)
MNANHTMKGNFSVNPNVAFALLTITPSTGGSAAATPGGGSYATGTSVSLTATPAANYTFSSWTVDSVSAGSTNPYVITMNGNHVVQANFTAIPAATYTLTVTPATGGTVTPTPSGTSFAPGATVSLAAVATPGFTFSGWTVDSANGGTTNPLSITMSANHTVLPTFTVIPAATYTLAVTPATGGTITPTPSGTSFAAGATVSLAAAATPGFTFSGWTVDGASGGAANPLSITMSGNHTVKANFTANAAADTTGPTLTISSLNNGAVTGNATLNVAGTVSDASGVASLTVNNVAVTITSGNFSYPFTLSAGPNIITTVATDTPGNKTTDTRTITLSSSAPSLNVSTPADNSKTAQSVATVSGTTSANTTVAVKVNSGTAQNAAITGSNFSATVNLTVGINTIDITATNTTAQTSNAKRTVTYDNSAPSLSVTSPAQDISTTLSSITISGTVSDSLTTVTIKIAADGQNYAPAIAQNGGFSQLIPLPTDKTYAVVVTATDEAGNNINVTRNVIRSAQLTQPTINDAIKVLLDVAGTTPLNAADKLRFDVAPLDNSGVPKGDGNIDDADVILILRRSIGIGSW